MTNLYDDRAPKEAFLYYSSQIMRSCLSPKMDLEGADENLSKIEKMLVKEDVGIPVLNKSIIARRTLNEIRECEHTQVDYSKQIGELREILLDIGESFGEK